MVNEGDRSGSVAGAMMWQTREMMIVLGGP